MLQDTSLNVRTPELAPAYFPAPVEDDETLGIEGEPFDEQDESGDEIVGPQTIAEERILTALYKDLARGERAKAVLAEAQMRRVAEINQQLDHKPVDGMGCLVARIPLDVYLAWMAREGHEFWHEKSNLDYFAHRAEGVGNPGFLIKTKMKPTILVDRKVSSASAGPANGVNSDAGAASAPASTAPKKARRSRGGRWAK